MEITTKDINKTVEQILQDTYGIDEELLYKSFEKCTTQREIEIIKNDIYRDILLFPNIYHSIDSILNIINMESSYDGIIDDLEHFYNSAPIPVLEKEKNLLQKARFVICNYYEHGQDGKYDECFCGNK